MDIELVLAAWDAEVKKSVKKVGDCQVWVGRGYGEKGYGLLKATDVAVLAHRAAFMKHFDTEPVGIVVQSCGNKRCVTKDHLAESLDYSL